MIAVARDYQKEDISYNMGGQSKGSNNEGVGKGERKSVCSSICSVFTALPSDRHELSFPPSPRLCKERAYDDNKVNKFCRAFGRDIVFNMSHVGARAEFGESQCRID
jgi:hypothetical protein